MKKKELLFEGNNIKSLMPSQLKFLKQESFLGERTRFLSDLEDSRSIVSDVQATSFTLNNYKNECLSEFYTNKYRKSNFGFELLPEQKNMLGGKVLLDNFGNMLNSVTPQINSNGHIKTEDLLSELSITTDGKKEMNNNQTNKNGMSKKGVSSQINSRNGLNNNYHGKNCDKMDQPIGGITKKENDMF